MGEGEVVLARSIGEGAEVLQVVSVPVVLGAERGGESAGQLEIELGSEVDRLGAALIGPVVVGRYRRNQPPAVIALDGNPGREIGILTHRRSTSGTTVTVGSADLAEGASQVQP